MRRFEHKKDGHNKFWEVERTGRDVKYSWGAIGAPTKSMTKTYYDVVASMINMDRKIREKLRKGYKEVNAVKLPTGIVVPFGTEYGGGAILDESRRDLQDFVQAVERESGRGITRRSRQIVEPVKANKSNCTRCKTRAREEGKEHCKPCAGRIAELQAREAAKPENQLKKGETVDRFRLIELE